MNYRIIGLLILLLVGRNPIAIGQITDHTVDYNPLWAALSEQEQIEYLKSELQSDSLNKNFWLILGTLWENGGQVDSAVHAYEKAYGLDAECERSMQLLANGFALQGRITRALKLYEDAISFNPNNSLTRLQYARLLKKERDFSKAHVQFSILLEKDSLNFYLWEQLGDCALRIDKQFEAIDAYKKSWEINRENLPLTLKLINAKVKSAIEPDSIMPYADVALSHDPAYIPIVKAKGLLYFIPGNYMLAEQWFHKAMIFGDTSFSTLRYLGISLFHIGDFLEAADLLEKSYAIDDSDLNLNYIYAKAMNNVGDAQKAVAVIEKTIELITPNPLELASLHGVMGDSYHRVQQYQKAANQYQKAYELNPDYFFYLHQKGTSQFSARQYAEAKSTFTQIVDILESDSLKKKKGSSAYYSAKHFIKKIDETLFFNDEIPANVDTIRLKDGNILYRYKE